jgi:hypothetical protein
LFEADCLQLHFVTVDANGSVVKVYGLAFERRGHERAHERRLAHLRRMQSGAQHQRNKPA